MIALATSKNWDLYRLDVKNALLNGDLQEEIYIEQPKGYEHPKYPSYACKLQKTLYSLKTFLLEVS